MTALWLGGWLFWQQCKSRTNSLQLLTLWMLGFYLCLTSLAGQAVAQYLQQNLQQLLGADSVLVAPAPLTDTERQYLVAHSQAFTEVRQFSLTLVHQTRTARLDLKAVGAGYPLLGALQISRQGGDHTPSNAAQPPGTSLRQSAGHSLGNAAENTAGNALGLAGEPATQGPVPGEIWLDPRAISALNVTLGEQLQVGPIRLRLTAVLLAEPDRLFDLAYQQPRAMLHLADLATFEQSSQGKQVQPQRWRYLLRHDERQQRQLAAFAAARVDWQYLSKQNSNHPLSALWLRVQKFAGLMAVLLLLLGAVTLDVIGKKLWPAQQYSLAVCQASGLSQIQAQLTALTWCLLPALLSLGLAALLAVICLHLLSVWLQPWLLGITPVWQWQQLASVLGGALLLLMLLQLPLWLRLSYTRLADLLRQPPPGRLQQAIRVGAPLLAMLLLTGLYADNWRLAGMLMAVLAGTVLGLLLTSWLTLWAGEQLTRRHSGLWAVCFYTMRQRLALKSAQMIGIGLSLLLLLSSVRLGDDLLQLFEQVAASQDGDLLIDRASVAQRQALEQWVLSQQRSAGPSAPAASIKRLQPFLDARLLAINGRALPQTGLPPSNSLRQLADGVRLHYAAAVPANNRLVAGQWQPVTAEQAIGWWQAAQAWPVSVEDEVATDLALTLGDRLTLQLGEQQFTVLVNSLHQLKAGSGLMTFWFVLQGEPPPALTAQRFYMGSAEVSPQALTALSHLWQQYPTLSLQPLAALKQRLAQFSHLGQAVILVFGTLIALLHSVLILATIQSVAAEDRKRNALLLSVGVSNRRLLQLISLEWLLTALLPLLSGAIGTVYLTSMLYQQLGMHYQPDWLWLSSELLLSVLAIAAAGVWLCRRQLQVSVRLLLQE